MKENNPSEKLLLPAVRAHMGDWIYYISSIKMKDIANHVYIAEEIHESSSLKELIQRQLTDRASEIREYLERHEQRFFNSFVIGIYGGKPQWHELEIKERSIPSSSTEIPSHLTGALGLLQLEGGEKLFAIDGQHRVAGIREAIESEKVNLENEEVSALFVGHKRTKEGRRRTRRLFTTLNRYAKPVSKKEAIALDEDDVIAIVTRKLVENYPLFKEKIDLTRGKNIPPADKRSFTSIVTLYDSLDTILQDRSASKWDRFKKKRPPEDAVDRFTDRSEYLFDRLMEGFPDLKDYCERLDGEEPARPFRNRENGGHILFRPIGLLLVANVIYYLMRDSDFTLDGALDRVSRIPVELSSHPWNGLLWDDTNKRMITSKDNRKAATRMTILSLGGSLSKFRTLSNPSQIKEGLSGLMNIPPDEVQIPDFTENPNSVQNEIN
jgi:DNA sulfur modification protein DndB